MFLTFAFFTGNIEVRQLEFNMNEPVLSDKLNNNGNVNELMAEIEDSQQIATGTSTSRRKYPLRKAGKNKSRAVKIQARERSKIRKYKSMGSEYSDESSPRPALKRASSGGRFTDAFLSPAGEEIDNEDRDSVLSSEHHNYRTPQLVPLTFNSPITTTISSRIKRENR